MPNVAFEAMGCGLPIVATKVGGIPELFIGELVQKGDQQAMAEALTRVLSTPQGREPIASHARQFSWENTANAYHKMLEGALG